MVSYTPSSDDVRLYEIAVLYPYPMNQKEEADLIKNIEGIFAEAGGKQIFKDVWGRRGLAYNIKGYDEGNFIIYYYELEPSKIDALDEDLRISKGMLRHMIVKPPKGYEITSYAEAEKKWKERERLEGERRAQEKEEKLKKQVVEKAKRSQSKPVKPKKDDAPAKANKESIDSQLDKLISDSDLDI